jgi:hypothetical protein
MADLELADGALTYDEIVDMLAYSGAPGVNVKWFGATGNGSTDDTVNIQRAVNWNSITIAVTAESTSATDILTFGANLTPAFKARIDAASNVNVTNVTDGATITTYAKVVSTTATTVTITADFIVGTVAIGDEIRFDFPHRGVIYFPPGTYKITSPGINLNYDGEQNIILRGHGNLSELTGSFSGYILDRSNENPTGAVRIIEALKITNTHATGGAIRFNGAVGGILRDLHISAVNHQAIFTRGGGPNTIQDVVLLGSDVVGSVGIFANGAISVLGCDITHFAHGIRHCSTGLTAIGNRFEVNNVGIMLGMDEDGVNETTTGGIISGGSMEANTIDIDMNACTAVSITGTTMGNGGAGTGFGGANPTRGIYCHGGANCFIAGVSIGGYRTVAGIDAHNQGGLQIGTYVINITGGGGSAITTDAAAPEVVTIFGLFPACTVTNLPDPAVYNQHTFTVTDADSTTASPTTAVVGGSTNRVNVHSRNDGGTWKWVIF